MVAWGLEMITEFFMFSEVVTGPGLLGFPPKSLRKVGEDTSGYLFPVWRVPPGAPCDAGFNFTELQDATLSLSEEIPFSRSVWFINPGTEFPRVTFPASLILGTGSPADLLLILESMLLVLDRFPAPLRDLLGRGKLRY